VLHRDCGWDWSRDWDVDVAYLASAHDEFCVFAVVLLVFVVFVVLVVFVVVGP